MINLATVRALVAEMIRPIRNDLLNLAARAVISLTDDAKMGQRANVSVLDGETRDAEVFGLYGFTSVAPADTEAVVIFPGGDRSHPIVIATLKRSARPTGWAAGEVGLHTDQAGHVVRLKRDKETVLGADLIRLGSDAATDPVVRKSDLQAVINAFDSHQHSETSVTTGPPLVPIGTATASSKVKAD